MKRVGALVAVSVLLGSACGAGSPTRDVAARTPTAQAHCDNPPEPPWSREESERIERENQAMEGDEEVARAHGALHPDEFAGVRWDFEGPTRVLVAFTGHLAEHRAALRAKAPHPDQIDAEPAVNSKRGGGRHRC